MRPLHAQGSVVVHDTEVAGAAASRRRMPTVAVGCSGSRARCLGPDSQIRRSFRPERGCRRRPRCVATPVGVPTVFSRVVSPWEWQYGAGLVSCLRHPVGRKQRCAHVSSIRWAVAVDRGHCSFGRSAAGRARRESARHPPGRVTIWWMVGAGYQVASTASMSSQNVLQENRPAPEEGSGHRWPGGEQARDEATPVEQRYHLRRSASAGPWGVDKPPRFRVTDDLMLSCVQGHHLRCSGGAGGEHDQRITTHESGYRFAGGTGRIRSINTPVGLSSQLGSPPRVCWWPSTSVTRTGHLGTSTPFGSPAGRVERNDDETGLRAASSPTTNSRLFDDCSATTSPGCSADRCSARHWAITSSANSA